MQPKTNLINLHTCHSRVTPDLKLDTNDPIDRT